MIENKKKRSAEEKEGEEVVIGGRRRFIDKTCKRYGRKLYVRSEYEKK